MESSKGALMPFMGQGKAVKEAYDSVAAQYYNLVGSDKSPSLNPLLFVLGTHGVGKTRFGAELDMLLVAYGRKHHAVEHAELLRALENVLYVPILFGNNSSFGLPVDYVYQGANQMEWILTARAIHQIFDIKEKYEETAGILVAQLGSTLPSEFNMGALKDYLMLRFKPSMIYIHVDKIFRTFWSNEALMNQIISRLASLQNNQQRAPNALIFTGYMQANFEKSIESPAVRLELESLTCDMLLSLMETMIKEKKLPELTLSKDWLKKQRNKNQIPWLDNNWQSNKPFQRLLADTGGVPTVIELLLDLCFKGLHPHSSSNMDELADVVSGHVHFCYGLSQNASWIEEAVHLSFSNLEFPSSKMTISSSPIVTLEELRINGVVFFKNVRKAANDTYVTCTMPFFFIRSVPNFGTISGLQSFWEDIQKPTKTLSWTEYTKYIIFHQIVRLQSLTALGITSMSLKEYYKNPCYSNYINNLMDLEIQTKPGQYVELVQCWPDSVKYPWPTSKTILDHQRLFDCIFLNPPGASIDGFQLAKTNKMDQFILIAYQNKFVKGDQTHLNAASICTDLQKIEEAFAKLENKIGSAHKLAKILNNTTVLTVFFTNRTIENDLVEKLAKSPLASRSNFIVMNDPLYFGPLASVMTPFE